LYINVTPQKGVRPSSTSSSWYSLGACGGANGGTTDPSGNGGADEGDDTPVYSYPSSGYVLKDIYINGKKMSTPKSPFKIRNMFEDVTMIVIFSK